MQYIKKGAAPHELKNWFDGQVVAGKRINSRYDDLDPKVKKIVEKCLLVEQGWLCCYTGMSLSEDNFHIEHLTPQSTSRANDTYEDVNYSNMLAAYPRGACKFGAKVRGDKHIPINPLQKTCGGNFDFDFDGHITGKNKAAKQTIEVLNLESPLLDEMRYQAIEAALSPNNKPRSEAQIKTIAEKYCTLNASGKYPRFCFVVSQVAQKQLEKIEKQRKRRKAIQGSKKK